MTIKSMGQFTAIGMRVKVENSNALVINTCGQNDTNDMGTPTNWVWSNPTNRAIRHHYKGCEAASVECLWQGVKIFEEGGVPDIETLRGDWRRGKAKRPMGSWSGEGQSLIKTPGEARRAIYIPAFRNLIQFWMQKSDVQKWVESARKHTGSVYLRDFDTGRGIDRNGPMSHAWVLAMYLNCGDWSWVDNRDIDR